MVGNGWWKNLGGGGYSSRSLRVAMPGSLTSSASGGRVKGKATAVIWTADAFLFVHSRRLLHTNLRWGLWLIGHSRFHGNA